MSSIDPTHFKYSDKTVGLADHIYICLEKNKPLDGQLRKYLKLVDRRQGAAAISFLKKSSKKLEHPLTKGKCGLIDYYATANARRDIYTLNCKKLLSALREGAIFDHKIVPPSLELLTFVNHYPDIVTDDDTYKDYQWPIKSHVVEYWLDKHPDRRNHLLLASAASKRVHDEMEADGIPSP